MTPAPTPSLLHRLAREPLIHFVLLGALVFAGDQVLLAVRGDPQEIVVGDAVRKEAREVFTAGMKREPNAAELKVLEDRWIDNEVLYREGLALGLDRGDSAIRERLIFKALSVAQAGLVLPKIDEPALRAWFVANRKRYDVATRFDFQEAAIVGDRTPQSLQPFVDALNGKGSSDTESSLRIFKDRPRDNLVQSYGAGFADALEKQAPGSWLVLASTEGPRVVRLESVKPGAAADFDAIKARVYQDWKDDTTSQLTTRAVRDMGRKYRIGSEGARL